MINERGLGNMNPPATSIAIPERPEDLQEVLLIRRWTEIPPPHQEILALRHFWSALQSQSLTGYLESVRQSPTFLLGVFQRRKARWWQIRAEEQGIALEILELSDA